MTEDSIAEETLNNDALQRTIEKMRQLNNGNSAARKESKPVEKAPPEEVEEEQESEESQEEEEDSEEEAKEEKYDSRKLKESFDRAAKHERYISKLRKELEDTKKKYETEEKELLKFREIERALKEEPLEMLERLGFTSAKLNQLFQERSDPRSIETRKLRAELEEIRRETREMAKLKEEQELQQARAQLSRHINKEIEQKEFDIISLLGAENTVLEYIEAYHEETGDLPDITEACEVIAKELHSKISKTSESKYLKKLKNQKAEYEDEDEEEEEEVLPKRTLTNKMTQSTSKVPKKKGPDDSFHEAVAFLKRSKYLKK